MYNIMHLSIYISYSRHRTASVSRSCFNTSMLPPDISMLRPRRPEIEIVPASAEDFALAR